MTDLATPASAPAEATPAPAQFSEVTAPANTPEKITLRDAGRMLRQARQPKSEETPNSQDGASEATPAPSSSQADDAAPQETEAPGATEAIDPASQEPPIEPPRSWTTEEKDAFRSLPREHQQKIAEREKGREAEFRRSQNEVAETRKAVDAERETMARARSQYEAALPQLLQTLHHNAEFADIRTQADVERMVNEDWPRYVRWDFHQKKIAAVQQELNQAQSRQQKEAQTDWEHFAKREDELFMQKAPELQDATKRTKTVEAAANLLKERGFTEAELNSLWGSKFLRDHRMQLVLLDAVRFQEAKATLAKAPRPTLPPVQRPGVSQPGKDRDAQIKGLEDKLDRSSGMNQLRAGAKLIAAMRANKR